MQDNAPCHKGKLVTEWFGKKKDARLASSVSRSKSDRIYMELSSKVSTRKRKSAELIQTIKSGSQGGMEQSPRRNCKSADSKCSPKISGSQKAKGKGTKI